MDNYDKQKTEEMAVFKNFLNICEYSIDENSVLQQEPPKPDICCVLVDNTKIEFEMANCIDFHLAQNMNDKKLKDDERGGFCDEPIEKIILDKNRKAKEGKYFISANKFELLVYTGIMPVWPHWNR